MKEKKLPPIEPTEQEKLNERFRQVFNALTNHGTVVKSGHDGKGVKAFARSIGTDGHIVANILNKEGRNITYEQAHNLRKLYGVNGSFLFMGAGPMFMPQLNAEPVSVNGQRENIRMVNVPVAASPATALDTREKQQPFALPGIEGEHFAFRVEGRSMQPTLEPGDTVICREIADPRQVRNGDMYAVVTRDGMMVKRVFKEFDERGKIFRLRLDSDNSVDFPSFPIEVDDKTTLYEVRHRLSNFS
jgi:SOS-response transcriptional repressor LexA